MEVIDRLLDRYPGRLEGQAGPHAKRMMFAEMSRARKTSILATRWEMGRLTGCGCVFSKMDVLHDGTMVPCHILSGVALAISAGPDRDVWQTTRSRALRERRSIRERGPGCQTATGPVLQRSCPGLRSVTGDFNRASPPTAIAPFGRLQELTMSSACEVKPATSQHPARSSRRVPRACRVSARSIYISRERATLPAATAGSRQGSTRTAKEAATSISTCSRKRSSIQATRTPDGQAHWGRAPPAPRSERLSR